MSTTYISDEETVECPLCMEEIDIIDRNFKPCSCGYQICRFCWNHILEDLNGLCPACRRPYSKDTVEFIPIPQEELASIKAKKRAKERERKEQELNARKHLSNVRVVQKNLVYVIGIPAKIATEETLRQHDYFGQYGKITKVVINKRNHTTPQGSSTNFGIYITYARKEDATKAINAVDGTICEGRNIKASYGTTKYCTNYLKGQQCQNPNCMYLHEPGEEADSYIKEKDESLNGSNVNKHHLKDPQNSKSSFPYAKETSFKVITSSSSSIKDDKEEVSALPVTASWAKLTKSSSSNSSLNSKTQTKILKQDKENEIVNNKVYSINSNQVHLQKSVSAKTSSSVTKSDHNQKITTSMSQQSLPSSNISNSNSNSTSNSNINISSSNSSINILNSKILSNISSQSNITSSSSKSIISSQITTSTSSMSNEENLSNSNVNSSSTSNQNSNQSISQTSGGEKPTITTILTTSVNTNNTVATPNTMTTPTPTSTQTSIATTTPTTATTITATTIKSATSTTPTATTTTTTVKTENNTNTSATDITSDSDKNISKTTTQTTSNNNTYKNNSEKNINNNNNNNNNNNSSSNKSSIKEINSMLDDIYMGSSALCDNSFGNNNDIIPTNAINVISRKYEGPFNPFCEDPFHFTEEEIIAALSRLQQKPRNQYEMAMQYLNQNINSNANKNIDRYQKMYPNQPISSIPIKDILSPEILPENKLNRMMALNNTANAIPSLNNVIKRKISNPDEVRNMFSQGTGAYPTTMATTTASTNLTLNGGVNENWIEMGSLQQQQSHQQQQYQQNLQSLVLNNSSNLNDINGLHSQLLNNLSRRGNNIGGGNQFNGNAATNYEFIQQHLHSLQQQQQQPQPQGINNGNNGNGINSNSLNYVNSILSPEMEYQNTLQFQNYNNLTQQQQQQLYMANHHSTPQQQQQLYQRMNNTNNTSSNQPPQQQQPQQPQSSQSSQPQQQQPSQQPPPPPISSEFFGQVLQQQQQHQKQNGQQQQQTHGGPSSMMNIPFQDPAIMAVRMGGGNGGQTASPYDTINNTSNQGISPLEYINSINSNIQHRNNKK